MDRWGNGCSPCDGGCDWGEPSPPGPNPLAGGGRRGAEVCFMADWRPMTEADVGQRRQRPLVDVLGDTA